MSAPRTSNNVTIRLGLLSMAGKIANVVDTEDERATKMFMVDAKGHKVKQGYHCLHDPACPTDTEFGWTNKELPDRGCVVNGEIRIMSAEEIEDAKGSKLAKGALDITPRPLADVEANMWPGAATYWFEPPLDKDGNAGAEYDVLRHIAASTEFAYMGTMNLRGNEKVYRLMPAWGGLVLQEMIWPAQLHTFKAPAVQPVPAKLIAMADALVAALVEPYNADDFASEKVAQLRSLIEAKAGNLATITTIGAATTGLAEDDMEARLTAALAMFAKTA